MALFNVLGALVKGVYLTVKRRFIDSKGVQFTVHLYLESKLPALRKKCLSLLEDLVLYDKELGGKETLLMPEQDKHILGGKTSTHIPLKTPEAKEAAEEPTKLADHSEYLHIVKKTLISSPLAADFAKTLSTINSFLEMDSDDRLRLLTLLKLLIVHSRVQNTQLSVDQQVGIDINSRR